MEPEYRRVFFRVTVFILQRECALPSFGYFGRVKNYVVLVHHVTIRQVIPPTIGVYRWHGDLIPVTLTLVLRFNLC